MVKNDQKQTLTMMNPGFIPIKLLVQNYPKKNSLKEIRRIRGQSQQLAIIKALV